MTRCDRVALNHYLIGARGKCFFLVELIASTIAACVYCNKWWTRWYPRIDGRTLFANALLWEMWCLPRTQFNCHQNAFGARPLWFYGSTRVLRVFRLEQEINLANDDAKSIQRMCVEWLWIRLPSALILFCFLIVRAVLELKNEQRAKQSEWKQFYCLNGAPWLLFIVFGLRDVKHVLNVIIRWN